MTSKAHSHIGASSMSRWSKCPGSVRLSEGIESTSSRYAEEGSAAHALAEHCLDKGYSTRRFANWWIDAKSERARFVKQELGGSRCFEVTDEMVEAVQVYIDTVKGDWKIGHELLIEHRFNLDNVHKGLFGTADAVLYDPEQKLLRVYDFKYGAGLAVDVKANPQLLYYGLGALLSTGHACSEVELVIVQPRCPHPDGPVRRWRTDALDLVDFSADLAMYAKATEDPNAQLAPGDWCRFCPAAGVFLDDHGQKPLCPAIHAKAREVARQEFSSDACYDGAALAETLTWLPVLEAWAKNVREFAYAEALQGRSAPGFKLVEKVARRKWREDVQIGDTLKSQFGLTSPDILKPVEYKSPAQIEKLLTKDQKAELKGLVTAESSGLVLAPESDKRPAVRVDAKSEFSAVEDIFS